LTRQNAKRLGDLISAARARAGLNTTELADLVGVNQSNISRLESGKISSPGPVALTRLSEVLRLPLATLYDLAGIPLPALRPYLRSSVGLSAEDAARAAVYIERLAAESAQKSVTGRSDDRMTTTT